MRALQVVFASALLGLGFMNTAAAETKLKVGVLRCPGRSSASPMAPAPMWRSPCARRS